MPIDLKDISLRTDEDGVWIAGSRLLPGCRAKPASVQTGGATEVEAVANFQEAAKAHLEAHKDMRHSKQESKGRQRMRQLDGFAGISSDLTNNQ